MLSWHAPSNCLQVLIIPYQLGKNIVENIMKADVQFQMTVHSINYSPVCSVKKIGVWV